MAHQHHHHGTENIKTAFYLNLLFTLIELIGGLLTNSMAILSDAVHDLGDSISLGAAWYFQKLSHKGSDYQYSYGYKRFSLIGAIINSVVLVSGSVLILANAVPRIIHPQQVEAKGMILLAIIGILANGIAVLRLKKGQSINEKVVSLHLLEDVLGWIAVLIGSILMHFFDIPVLDPIMSVGIAIFVLFNVAKSIKHSMRIILQGTPADIDVNKLEETLCKTTDIEAIHDLHVWSIDGSYNILTVHVVLKENKNLDDLISLKKELRNTLLQEGIHHSTIEFEKPGENCDFENCCG